MQNGMKQDFLGARLGAAKTLIRKERLIPVLFDG
jgi:hypothetical protein